MDSVYYFYYVIYEYTVVSRSDVTVNKPEVLLNCKHAALSFE